MSPRIASPSPQSPRPHFVAGAHHGKLAYLRGHLGPARRRDPTSARQA